MFELSFDLPPKSRSIKVPDSSSESEKSDSRDESFISACEPGNWFKI